MAGDADIGIERSAEVIEHLQADRRARREGGVLDHHGRVGGDELDEAIINYIKRAYNVLIGERTAEEVKIKMGSAYPLKQEMEMEVKGRDLVTGLPKTLEITSEENQFKEYKKLITQILHEK